MTPHLFGLLPDELVEISAQGPHPLSLDEARRALSAVVANRRLDGGGGRPIAAAKTAQLARLTRRAPLEVVERVPDPHDGSQRYLFRAPDGAVFESVRIPLEREGRFTVCLSSQAGCAMACAFCATGRLGLGRNLEPWEMVAQWWTVASEAPGRISGAVFMGQGEPFHNERSVLHAAAILRNPNGGRIAAEAITISTVGLSGPLQRYIAEDHPYKLIVGLHSAVPERRAQLLPVVGRQPLDLLLPSLTMHAQRFGRVPMAWVLLGGLNTGDDEIEALGRLAARIPLRLNVIDLNGPPQGGLRRATDGEREHFLDGLRRIGVPFQRRYSVGSECGSACGMLAAQRTAL